MKSVCLYSSYVQGDGIPFYVRFYLEQLRPHFDEIIYITNNRKLESDSHQFLQQLGVTPMFVENEGYDFGMWYKAFQVINPDEVSRLGLINDSCVLFKDLNLDFQRIDDSNADYCGMVISDRYATHLQSFFLVLNQRAISVLKSYFSQHGIISDYRQVIQTFEIGLTQEMIRRGLTVYSLYNNDNRSFPKNPSFALVKELIDEGMPLIKKKIVFRNYRGLEYYWVVRMNFDTDYRKYFAQIKEKYGSHTIDLVAVMSDAPRKSHFDLYFFRLARAVANLLRKIPGIRWMFHQVVFIFKKYFRKS